MKKYYKRVLILLLLLFLGFQCFSYADSIAPEEAIEASSILFGLFFAFSAIIISVALLTTKLSKNKNEKTNTTGTKRLLYIFGALLSFCLILIWILREEISGLFFLIPLILFIIAMIVKSKPKVSDYLGIISIIVALLIPFAFGIPASRIATFEEKKKIGNEEAWEHNKPFENCFGTEVTFTDTMYLLSEIRNNNIVAEKNGEESSVIYVCLISKNASANENMGVYSSSVDPKTINKSLFNDMIFSKETAEIIKQLNAESSYTINIPNLKTKSIKSVSNKKRIWRGIVDFSELIDKRKKKENGSPEAYVNSPEGYYSNGYIRSIYIVDNANRDN